MCQLKQCHVGHCILDKAHSVSYFLTLYTQYLAPDVAINGGLSVIEDNDITLTCDYVDVLPFGNLSVLYFGDVSVVQDKVRIYVEIKSSLYTRGITMKRERMAGSISAV